MVLGVLAVVLALDVAVFRLANRASDHLDESRMLVTEKIFGILLAALAALVLTASTASASSTSPATDPQDRHTTAAGTTEHHLRANCYLLPCTSSAAHSSSTPPHRLVLRKEQNESAGSPNLEHGRDRTADGRPKCHRVDVARRGAEHHMRDFA